MKTHLFRLDRRGIANLQLTLQNEVGGLNDRRLPGGDRGL